MSPSSASSSEAFTGVAPPPPDPRFLDSKRFRKERPDDFGFGFFNQASGTQLPWKPNGTRCGALIRATGRPEKSPAS